MLPHQNSIDNQLQSAGYAFLPAHLAGESSENVARSIGGTIWLGKGGTVQGLKPKHETDARPTTYMGSSATIYSHFIQIWRIGVFPLVFSCYVVSLGMKT
jgi:hypothetical protein